ncbi:MAG: hypothetical protein WKG00_20090 [Polyangiaceae bacterium]
MTPAAWRTESSFRRPSRGRPGAALLVLAALGVTAATGVLAPSDAAAQAVRAAPGSASS